MSRFCRRTGFGRRRSKRLGQRPRSSPISCTTLGCLCPLMETKVQPCKFKVSANNTTTTCGQKIWIEPTLTCRSTFGIWSRRKPPFCSRWHERWHLWLFWVRRRAWLWASAHGHERILIHSQKSSGEYYPIAIATCSQLLSSKFA